MVAGRPPRVGTGSPLRAAIKRLLRADAYDREVSAAVAAQGRDGVRFIGEEDDVPRLLAASDVVTFPSTVPHFARPIIEAGAMAKPVVASRLGGPLELVEDGVTGVLAPPDDVEALATALVGLLRDPARRTRMGEAGYQRVRERFDASAVARRVFEVYEEILK
jgi:glycosyltransferase involved in cell wall biosynthesis